MDDVYTKAMARRDQLKRELSDIELFLALYERFSSETEQKQIEVPVSPLAVAKPKRRVKPSELADIIERLIRERGMPMQRGEILDALAASDVELESQDPAKYIGTILWRNSSRFVNVPGEGYTLPDQVTQHRHMKISEARSSSEQLTEEASAEIENVALHVASAMSGEDSRRVAASLEANEGIPQDIDGRLLTSARETFGRHLDQQEKRVLRDQFRKLI